MSRLRWILVMVAALSAGAACSDDPVGSVPRSGTVTLRLTTPHADDGAMMFAVSGPPIDSAVAIKASLRLFTRRTSDSTVVGVVAGVVTNGDVVTLHVPNVAAAADYTARVVEVADRRNAVRGSLTGYALAVGP